MSQETSKVIGTVIVLTYLETTSGRINIFSILISNSPGNWK